MARIVSLGDWRARARRRLPRFVFDYLEGGADDEAGVRRNIAALGRATLIPERLKDVASVCLRSSLFGSPTRVPLIVAPTGLNGLFWPDGDIALARAAHRAGIPFVLSTAATTTLETLAAQTPGEKWFQLYVLGDRSNSERLLARAQQAGYTVLVLTVDVPVNGNRERDIRNGFTVPLSARPGLVFDMLLHPRWLMQLLAGGIPRFANFAGDSVAGDRNLQAALLSRTLDSSLTWQSLEWLRAHWRGPIVLKGILSRTDAVRARDSGADAVIVSNHGGRQLAALPAPIDMISSVVSAVGPQFPVLIDSGFRSGVDIVKALALGAQGVLIGRPLLYGLACAGEQGAYAVLDTLTKEVARTLALIGINDIRQLRRRHVRLRR